MSERSFRQWIIVALGLSVLVIALVSAADPYRQTREFRAAVLCEESAGDCLATERGSIVGRRTYTTTTTETGADGHMSTSTTTNYEVTWQRPDGSRQTREVSSSFYDKVREGQPATLRLWRGEVVGVEVTGGAESFLPQSGTTLGNWLLLAFFGLGVLLWGLLFGWWDGLLMLAFRAFCWMFIGAVSIGMTTHVLAFGLPSGVGLGLAIAMEVWCVGIAGSMLISSLDAWC